MWVLDTQKVWGPDVCANSSPFSDRGEKVRLYLRAPFPPSALWITVIVSFVALSRMTDYDQQDGMRSPHCRSDAFRSLCLCLLPRTPERVPVLFRPWQPPCSTGRRRCDPAGQVTRRLQASQCRHTIEFLTFSPMFETVQHQFPRRSGAHHPGAIESPSGGHNCLVHICSKQENMQRFDSQKIRELF